MEAIQICSKCESPMDDDELCSNERCSSNAPTWKPSKSGRCLVAPDARLNIREDVPCRACDELISPTAVQCPHCGQTTDASSHYRQAIRSGIPQLLTPKPDGAVREKTTASSEEELPTRPDHPAVISPGRYPGQS